jgi:hypothetical protein
VSLERSAFNPLILHPHPLRGANSLSTGVTTVEIVHKLSPEPNARTISVRKCVLYEVPFRIVRRRSLAAKIPKRHSNLLPVI